MSIEARLSRPDATHSGSMSSLEAAACAQVEAERGLRPVSLAGFMDATPYAHPFAAWPLLPLMVLTLLAGHGGSGKSLLALIFAAHSACGRTWAGVDFDRCRVVYVSLEDSGDLVRYRLKRICEAYGLDASLIERNLTVLDGTGGDASLMIEVNDHGQRQLVGTPLLDELEEAAHGAGYIIVDNASDAFSGNENERRQVRTFIRRLVDLATLHGAGLMLLAHVDKHAARNGSAGNSYSGSTAWHNSARSRLALTTNDDGTVTLTQEKLNLGRAAEPITLAWNDTGVLMPAALGAHGSKDLLERVRDDAEQALPSVAAALGAGIRVPTGTSGSSTSWHAVQHLPEMPAWFHAKDGKRRFHGALVRLESDGIICRVTAKDEHRNVRERWQLTQAGEKCASKSALRRTPNTPVRTNARTNGALVADVSTTNATNATNAGRAYLAARDGDL